MTTTNHNEATKTAKKLARSANSKIRTIGKRSEELFGIVLNAYQQLEDNKKAWALFKLECDAAPSTINKIVAIANCEYVMSQLDVLPLSWGTLHTIAVNADKYSAEFDSAIQRAKDGEVDNVLSKKTTRAQVLKLIPKDEDKTKPVKNVIRFDSSLLGENAETALEAIELLQGLGFEIKDLNPETEEAEA